MELLSFSSFLVTLRETMEAALIVGIILAYLNKTNNEAYKKDIWLGTGIAVICSMIGAVLFEIFLGGFEGDQEKLFEGIVMILAAGVLTWMIIWMMHSSKTIKLELEEKTNLAISGENRYALVTLAFISVLREGIETVLFLAGIGATEAKSAVFFSGFLGIITATFLAILLFRGSYQIDIGQFFKITSIILIFFAAGLFSHGIHEFRELGWFGDGALVTQLWNTSNVLDDHDNGWGAMLRALFGYEDQPTLIELVSYIIYWISISIAYFRINTKKLDLATPTSG
ncbi:MAG: FTR1 family iron permease [Candidatus Kariarchaeaceae archaeon]|jgi:high-affinity iron transporter